MHSSLSLGEGNSKPLSSLFIMQILLDCLALQLFWVILQAVGYCIFISAYRSRYDMLLTLMYSMHAYYLCESNKH